MQKRHLKEIITDAFCIPLEAIASIPNAQFVGNSELSIDGCLGIKKYETSEIIISAKDYIVRISGSSLTMMTFSGGRVSIRGLINKYEIVRV